MKKAIAMTLICILLISAFACIKKKDPEIEPALTPIPVQNTDAPSPTPTEQPATEPTPTDEPEKEPSATPNTDATDDVFDATESLTPEERALCSYWVKAAKFNPVTGKNDTIYWRVYAHGCDEVEETVIKEYNMTHDDKIPLIKSNEIRYYVAGYEVFFPRDYKEPEDGKGIPSKDAKIKLEIKDENGNDIVGEGIAFQTRDIETDYYDVHAGSCYRGMIIYPMYIGTHYLFEYTYHKDGSDEEFKCYQFDSAWEGPPVVVSWERDYNWEDYAWAYE